MLNVTVEPRWQRMEKLRGVVEMQGRNTPACPTAIHMAAEAADNRTIPMSPNPGATNPLAILTKRRHAILVARQAV